MENKTGAYFFNKVTNQTKESLTEAEAALGIMPMLNPYDNELVMSLQVQKLRVGNHKGLEAVDKGIWRRSQLVSAKNVGHEVRWNTLS